MNIQIPEHLSGEEWARMPKPKQRLQGLSRTTLLELAEANRIRSVVIKKPGAIRGIRLIYLPSLHEFLNGLASEVV